MVTMLSSMLARAAAIAVSTTSAVSNAEGRLEADVRSRPLTTSDHSTRVGVAVDLAAFWRFQKTAVGADGSIVYVDDVHGYELLPDNASWPPSHVSTHGGVFGEYTVEFKMGQRLWAPRATVPALAAIAGHDATVTVVAWVKLTRSLPGGCIVGGLWEEDTASRQYAIFMDHTAHCAADNGLVAHISAEGGPSPGQPYCESAACGASNLSVGVWHCLANVYNGTHILAYVNGSLDSTDNPSQSDRNPFAYPNPPRFPNGGIYKPPPGQGANLTLGANMVKHTDWPVKHLSDTFIGLIGGFAVQASAMSPADLAALCRSGRA